jgi:hypothetical protein
VGRRPTTADLGLEHAGLEPGRPVRVDRRLRAAGVPGGWLYAIGDCNGLAPLTHMGKYHGRIAAAAILGQDVADEASDAVVSRVTFTDPQVCAVGLTAAQARAAGLRVTVVSTPTGEVPGAYTQGDGIRGTSQLVIDDQRRTVAGAGRLLLSAPGGFLLDGATAHARLHLTAGQTLMFALQHAPLWDPPLTAWAADEIAARLADTVEGWRSWCAIHQTYEGPWRDLVHHSGRVLEALTFAPTGAIVAAPTTSLPETVGGERNWDYRYTWVRDVSLTMEALWVAACPDEANKFFGFLADAAASQLLRGVDLQIMFGIGGERDLSERELPHLAGWRDSQPVRVGNGAWTQRQLDVYGELLGAAQRLTGQLGELDPVTQRFLAAAADTAASRWKKDQGIWEIRGESRDFLYSKLMCWVALDRAVTLAPRLGAGERVAAWTTARDEIRAAILEHGWNSEVGAFTQAFGGEDLDASNLMMAITGFLPGDDPRMKATIDATAERLTDKRGLVYRYLAQDGLAGEEGTFLLCTFWLAQAQAMAGEVDQAVATFERAVSAINDVGLLAEEIDADGEMIGNFPQAFSHIGLVNAAWAISQAQQRRN